MNIGLGIGIPFTRSSLWASIFTPSALFLDGSTEGVWYDPSDINLTWRRNLLTYSEQFDNAVWLRTANTISPNSTVAPDGTMTTDKLVETTATNTHEVRQDVATAAAPYVFSAYVKAAGRNFAMLYHGQTGAAQVVNLTTGALSGNAGLGSPTSATTSNEGNGWFRVSITITATAASNNFRVYPLLDAITYNYTGDGTSGIYIWGAQLEQGSTATPYQRITDGIQDYLQYQPLPVMYRDAAGTLPVTAVEQPVGLMLDKSNGLVLGPELVTNGGFGADTGWSKGVGWEISGGAASINGTNTASSLISQSMTLASGKWYEVRLDVLSNTSGRLRLNSTLFPVTSLSVATYSWIFQAATTTADFRIEARDAGTIASIDNISVRELPGNHAFNPSGNSANFPVLSARVNLLERTEDFTNAYWSKNAAVAVTQSGVIGTISVPNTIGAGVNIFFRQSLSTVINTTSRIEVRGPVGVSIALADDFGTTAAAFTGDWQTITLNTTGNGGFHQFYIRTVTANQAYSFEIRYPDFRVANDALNQPAYQRVNTSTDYDTVGFKPYVRFNGVSQWLQTNSIDFSYGDKMFVSAGVRKLSDAIGVHAELSNNANGNNGSFNLISGNNVGASDYDSLGRGTAAAATNQIAYAAPFAAPDTSVISASHDIAGSLSTIRRNSVAGTSATGSKGTGNFGNYPLYIGARAGSSLWFNGRLYQLVIAAGSEIRVAEEDSDLFLSESGDFITAETTVAVIQSAIEQTEAFVNRKTSAF